MKNKKKILLIIGMWLFTIIVLVLRFLDRRALITGTVEQICYVLMWICMMVVWILGALIVRENNKEKTPDTKDPADTQTGSVD